MSMQQLERRPSCVARLHATTKTHKYEISVVQPLILLLCVSLYVLVYIEIMVNLNQKKYNGKKCLTNNIVVKTVLVKSPICNC